MSNSSLVNYTCISPNSNNPRNAAIKKITIHHMAGNLSVESCGSIFLPSSRQASANYGIGSDGRVGMYVEEKNRSWCSSSPANDHQAVTIEVANDEVGGNWHVSDAALAKLIELCADICKRNGIASLNYTGDTSGNLTRHNMFKATTCPGAYLQSKFDYIAEQVNAALGGTAPAASTSASTSTSLKPIETVQTWLNTFSFNNIAVDNIAGTNTKKAIIKVVQSALGGLTVDGIFGAKSKAAWKNVKSGAAGDIVKAIQAMYICLGLSLTDGLSGSFGSGTVTTTKAYQKSKGYAQDAIVGVITATGLYA